ncbi:DUF1641 domain-containing protein [Cohnella lubricantis]|uniref:DUF1641 domain-containing protein n=1 Tax=Cohnella lubricantis TaxID=2163172 RepID=A0A841T631_9BACL|nr:DUF1641 domain-containing protein [Cohnella lubricantis]MBB6676342.1 DUF1641 domain-containing protein [Cohnella lubricantis]MBP2120289.1 uncharacterized protein YjgD (DUF1641 family) [Cohnella lubricantis]
MSQISQEALESQDAAVQRNPQELLDQLLKPEVQESLTVLVDNLPKLTEMVTFLTAAFDFAKNVATDKVLINDFAHGIGEFVKPVAEKAKGIAAAAIEANERAEADTSTIGMFGVLKLLKDPQVQKTLKFTQAFLGALSENKQQR